MEGPSLYKKAEVPGKDWGAQGGRGLVEYEALWESGNGLLCVWVRNWDTSDQYQAQVTDYGTWNVGIEINKLRRDQLVQFSSVAQSCPTLCNPMNCSTPGLPIHHQLPESTQTHALRVGDAMQPSHPLLSPCPPAPNPSHYQGLFQMSQLFTWGGQSTGVSASASVIPMNTQDWSPLGWTGWISLQSKGLSRVFSNTRVQKYQFFGSQLSL